MARPIKVVIVLLVPRSLFFGQLVGKAAIIHPTVCLLAVETQGWRRSLRGFYRLPYDVIIFRLI